jgi:hypothetical protein
VKDLEIGKIAYQQSLKDPYDQNSYEYSGETVKSLEKEVLETVQAGLKKYPREDFFVVILTKKEQLMLNTIRNYLFVRKTCPLPFYDQIVWRYDHLKDDLEFLWVLPAKDIANMFLANVKLVDPSEYCLLQYLIKYRDGDLHALAKKLNKEHE